MRVATNRPRHLVLGVLSIVLSAVMLAATVSTATAAGEAPRSMWVWEQPSPEIVDFAVERGIDVLYLNAAPGFSSQQGFSEFIALANTSGIEVWALAGDPQWAIDSSPMLAWADEVAAFGQFVGLSIDVEPWALSGWSSSKDRRKIIRSYLAGLDAVSNRNALPVNAAVPFWFDDRAYGKRTKLIDEVMRRVDAVSVLAYRDTASGPDGIIELTSYEVQRGAELGVDVVIAVETDAVAPDKVTFAEEGVAAMEAELALVEAAYAGSPGFAGLAIHHYGSYANLAN